MPPKWSFESKTDGLKSQPVLVVTSEDGLAPANTAFCRCLAQSGQFPAQDTSLADGSFLFRSAHRPFHGSALVARNPAIGTPQAPVNRVPDGTELLPPVN